MNYNQNLQDLSDNSKTIGIIPRLLIFLSIITITISTAIRFRYWNFDDGLIVSRIVNNILSGSGWTYNVDEAVNASTSVLHTILVTSISYFNGDIPLAAHIIGGIAIFLSAITAFILINKLTGAVAAYITSIALILHMAGNYTWGLESHLFISTVLIFLLVEACRINSWPWLGIVTLTRPDGILFVFFKSTITLIKNRNLSFIKGALQWLLVVAPWCIFSLVTFGQLFPDTLSNKIWQGSSGFWGNGHIYFKALAKHLLIVPPWYWGIYALSIIGAWRVYISKDVLLYLAAFTLCQQLTYIFLNIPGYHWYFSLLDVVILIYGGIGFGAVIKTPFNKYSFNRPCLWICVISGVVYSGLCIWNYQSPTERDPRDAAYEKAIKTIEDQNFPPGSIAALEVGTIGYHTKRKIVDLTGLTSANPEFISGLNIDKFFDIAPQIVIVHSPPWHFERAIYDDIRFKVMYPSSSVIPDPYFPLEYFVKKEDLTNTKELESYARSKYKIFHPISAEIVTTAIHDENALCIIDQINGQMANKQEIWSSRYSARLVGWAVDKSQNELSPVLIRLRSEKDEWFELEAARTSRPDVAKHLSRPDWELSGYDITGTLIDIPPGKYQINIAQQRGAKWTHCVPGITLVLR